MKWTRHLLAGLLLAVLLGYSFKGVLYRSAVVYKAIGQRKLIKIEDDTLQRDLDFWVETNNVATLEDLLLFANEYATGNLSYTFGKCSVDPNEIVASSQRTNCVGYSAAFHSVVAYLLVKKGWSRTVISEHKVAHLYFGGHNVHPWFSTPAFKDHDYNVITDLTTQKRYIIDPTLKACCGIATVVEQH